MDFHIDFWNNKKRAESAQQEKYREREQTKKLRKTERNLNKSSAINKSSVAVLNQTLQNEKNLQERISDFNLQVADFQKKVDENQKLQNELQIQQQRLSDWEEELKNRAEDNRKEEISIHIRSENVKKEELRVAKKDTDLDAERQNIKDERISMKSRIEKAELAEKEYRESKDKFDEKQKDADKRKIEFEDKLKELDSRETECKKVEDDISRRLSELEEKERNFSLNEKNMRDSFDEEKAKWEKDRAEIESNLNEKIKEYDRKLSDMEAFTKTMDNIAFDDSEDGKKAKIVVKETIRVSMKTLEDILQKFKELDEKYVSGTFEGFSIPIDEISNTFEDLKGQYTEVKEHADSTGLNFSIWLKKIEDSIFEADKNFKSFLFAECYRNILEGLSYCDGYANIIDILNEYAGGNDSENEDTTDSTDDWIDYYEVLYEDDFDDSCDYTEVSEKDLKKQYRKMLHKWHPDKASEENKAEHTEKTKRLTEIWELLSDKNRRADYDRTYIEKRANNNQRKGK